MHACMFVCMRNCVKAWSTKMNKSLDATQCYAALSFCVHVGLHMLKHVHALGKTGGLGWLKRP